MGRSLTKKLKRQQRQEELLKHFTGDFYQEKQVGDNWYVKMWNGTTDKWQVAIFSFQSFNNYKRAHQKFAETKISHLQLE